MMKKFFKSVLTFAQSRVELNLEAEFEWNEFLQRAYSYQMIKPQASVERTRWPKVEFNLCTVDLGPIYLPP